MKVLATILFIIAVSGSTALAETISKSFEIGAGTANGTSHRRDFTVPSGVEVEVKVRFSRKGNASAANDVPLTIELISPATSFGGSPEVIKTREVTAKTTEQTITMKGEEAFNGCSVPWSVRVKGTDGSPAVAVTGQITLTNFVRSGIGRFLNGSEQSGLIPGYSLDKGRERSFGIPIPPSQGKVYDIGASWDHNLFIFPIKMRVEILNPDGTVVASGEGFSQKHDKTPKFKLNKLLTNAPKPGNWIYRVTNLSDHDAINIRISLFSEPGCF